MLGPNKWILFTIVGGILLSIHIDAIDSPTKALISPEIQSFTNKKLGITIENLHNVPKSSRRQLRNLVPPYQEFSNVDGVQFIDSRSRNSKKLPGTFGSFRFDSGVNLRPSSSPPSPFRRRSDEYDESIGTYPASAQLGDETNYDFDYSNEDNGTLALIHTSDNTYNRFQNRIIPITFVQAELAAAANNVVKTKRVQKVESEATSESNAEAKESVERSNKQLDQVRFPDKSIDGPRAEALTARRSGIQFAENESEIKPQNYNPFIPQSYSEESLNFGDAIPQFQRPFNNEDIVVENENDRAAVGNRYYRPYIQPYRDEVTKFGDVNGPITSFNRPVREYNDQTVSFPRTQFESTVGYYEPDSPRPPRHFFPPKVYTEYAADYAPTPQINSKYYQPTYSWKSRQPRVVFPPSDFTQGTTGTTYVGNENVVFR